MTRCVRAVLAGVLCLVPGLASASDARPSSEARSADFETRKLPGGATLRIARGSEFHVGRPINVQLGKGQTLAQTVRLTRGRVEVDLPESKQPTTAVLVQGPSRISAIAKGGHSIVIADAKRVTIGAIAGEMLVASGNDWRTLPSGVVRDYVSGAAADHAVLPAPRASVSAPIALSVAGQAEGSFVNVNASKLPKANGYVFGLWKVGAGEPRLMKRLPSETGSVQLGGLSAGSYGISVHGIEASGLEGAESEVVPLRVVSAELPDGARMTSSGILLPPNQRVRLVGTDGVEVSYGKAASFVPAPSTIGLIRGQSTLVRLRAAGAKEELSLSLSPRATHAQVRLSPARAEWPRDHISIDVELTNGSGKPLAEDVPVTPQVFVNVAKVKVDWKRKGNILTAKLPPSAELVGPWVVRVEVRDDTNAVVGRNFLEIAREKTKLARNR